MAKSNGKKKPASGKNKTPKMKPAVRVAKFQVGDVEGGIETLRQWRTIAESCRDIVNTIHNQWIVWHECNGSWELITEWLKTVKAWHEYTGDKRRRGKKPKCPVECTPSTFTKALWQTLKGRFPTVHSRVMSLLIQDAIRKLKSRPAAQGMLPAWMAILLGRESLPTSTRPWPIPFDIKNKPVFSQDGAKWQVSLRLDRDEPLPGKKMAPASEPFQFALRTESRKAASERIKLERIVAGEYKFCGSKIMVRDRKWFLLLCYQQPKSDPAEKLTGQAVLTPGEDHPWTLTIDGREIWLGGDGREVAAVRRRVFRQRDTRKRNYRNAGSANKGHGRNRTLGPVFRLTRRWKDFVKTHNHTITRRAVQICLEHKISTLVYEQPIGTLRDRLFLATSGKSPEWPDANGWDWYGVGSQLGYKGQHEGISIVVKKVGEEEEEGEHAA